MAYYFIFNNTRARYPIHSLLLTCEKGIKALRIKAIRQFTPWQIGEVTSLSGQVEGVTGLSNLPALAPYVYVNTYGWPSALAACKPMLVPFAFSRALSNAPESLLNSARNNHSLVGNGCSFALVHGTDIHDAFDPSSQDNGP
jgi:hypothetical protein